METILK
jgi:beta-N-acetylglucosaminidase.